MVNLMRAAIVKASQVYKHPGKKADIKLGLFHEILTHTPGNRVKLY